MSVTDQRDGNFCVAAIKLLLRKCSFCRRLPPAHSLRCKLKLCGHFLHLPAIAVRSHVESKKREKFKLKQIPNERAFKMQMKGSRYQEVSSDNTLHDLHASSSDLRFLRMPPPTPLQAEVCIQVEML